MNCRPMCEYLAKHAENGRDRGRPFEVLSATSAGGRQSPGDGATIFKVLPAGHPVPDGRRDVPTVPRVSSRRLRPELKRGLPGQCRNGRRMRSNFFLKGPGRPELKAGLRKGRGRRTDLHRGLCWGCWADPGSRILCKVLSDSENRTARKADHVRPDPERGPGARMVLTVLEDPTQKWFLEAQRAYASCATSPRRRRQSTWHAPSSAIPMPGVRDEA